MKKTIGTAILVILVLATALAALEPPTREQLEKYRRDGTLPMRIERALAIGNHRVPPRLLRQALDRIDPSGRWNDANDGSALADPRTPPPAWRGMPTKGNVKVLVLLIAFADAPATNTAATVNSKIFGNGVAAEKPYESLRNYYQRSSYDQLNLSGSVLGWYTTAYARASVEKSDEGRENLIMEALQYYNSQGHDFSQYDNDGDGTIDYFAVIWTGVHEDWAEFWWGYQTSWYKHPDFTLDGKQLGDYSWQWESYNYPGTFYVSTLIHETGHALGVPDYYDYDDSVGPKGGVGGLDIMDATKGDHNCFSKFLLDWITPKVYSGGVNTVSLRDSGTSKDAAIFMPGAQTGKTFFEFFMVQNRFRSGNDANANYPADGLLIWHVDATLKTGNRTYLYDNSYTSHKLLRLMEADGLEEIEADQAADAGDYYVAGKQIGPATSPDSDRYNGTATDARLGAISATSADMTCTVSFSGRTLVLQAGSGGTTNPAPGTYTFTPGEQTEVTALPNTAFDFTGWSGGATGSANPLTVTMDANKTIKADFRFVHAPIATGRKQLNRSFSQVEYINILTWQANPANQGLSIAGYRIYDDQSPRVLVGEVDASHMEYWHRRQGPGSRTYAIVAVTAGGRDGAAALVTVPAG